LCSYDQYSNLVLEEAFERRIFTDPRNGVTVYSDIPLGIYVVRGDTVVLMGKMLDGAQQQMKEVDLDELAKLSEESKASLTWDFDADLVA